MTKEKKNECIKFIKEGKKKLCKIIHKIGEEIMFAPRKKR